MKRRVELTARSTVAYRVLGPVEALRDGRPLPLGGRRQRALLALLLQDPGRPVGVDRLIDELWSGEPPDGAEVSLRTYVSRLRAALGSDVRLSGSSAGYVLDVAAEAIDARRFERLIRDGDAALVDRNPRRARDRLAAALELWQGSAYGDLGADGSLRVEAERLDELRLYATELRIEADLGLGAAAGLVDELERLTRAHPFRERLWRQLMLALYRANRQADALDAYRRAREQLAEQLGLEPGDELEQLQLAILRHEVPNATPPEIRHNLPAPVTSFIGRTAELAVLERLFADHRLVTLTGVGGVGKTRLAIELARRHVAEVRDGAWFVDLSAIADPELIAGHICSALSVREQPGASPQDHLAMVLREQDLMLVLDNCEHLRDGVATIAERLLRTVPGLRILATSRELLGVPGEVDHPVPPLDVPSRRDDVELARSSEAVSLLLERVRAVRPGLAESEDAIRTAAQICADLDGLPLAIELAAARARALSLADIADRLADRFRFLISWRRLTSARHRTLREAMDWSYDLLGSDEQHLLEELSVFAGGFTLEAVASVCTGDAQERALELVERLVDASLVIVDDGAGTTRYRLLETVRQYGAERLEAAGRSGEVRELHASHFRTLAEGAREPLRTSGVHAELVPRLIAERENIRAALAWSRDAGKADQVLRIAEAVWRFWWFRGELTEGRAWLDWGVAAAIGSEPDLRARGLLGAAGLAWAQGDYDAASRHATAAHALFEQSGNHEHAASSLNTLGLIAVAQREFDRSRALFEASMREHIRSEADQAVRDRNVAIALDNLGSVAHELGDDATALARYHEARDINTALLDEEGVAMNDLHIAIILGDARQWTEARRLLGGALSVYRRLEFLQYVAECLEATAMVANGAGSHREAAFALGVAQRVRDQLGNLPVQFMLRLRDREVAAARVALGDEEFNRAFGEGSAGVIDPSLARLIGYLTA